jgi:glycosyltransferase involved in cell wall biosynthesis
MVDKPLVSIIIPCRNEEQFIGKCINSIIAQDYPKDKLEVLAIDGMSEDGSKDIIMDYQRQYPFVRLLTNTKRIIPAALNIGIRNATGEIIVRMDAHAEYTTDYLLKSIEVLEKSGADVAGGVVVNCVSDNLMVARAIALITNHPFGVGSSPFRTRKTPGFVDSVVFGTFRRSVFERFGLFDERFTRNQDSEMWGRIIKNGGKIFLDPSIKVYYFNQPSLKGFVKQAIWTGMWIPITSKLRKGVMRWRHYAPLCFDVYVFLLTTMVLFGYWKNSNELLMLGILGFLLYGVPCVISSFQMISGTSTVKGGLSVLPFILTILPVYHLTYGLGSLFGLFMVLTNRYKRYLGSDVSHIPPRLSGKDHINSG